MAQTSVNKATGGDFGSNVMFGLEASARPSQDLHRLPSGSYHTPVIRPPARHYLGVRPTQPT